MELTPKDKLIIRQVAVKCACDTYSIKQGSHIPDEIKKIRQIAEEVEKIILEV